MIYPIAQANRWPFESPGLWWLQSQWLISEMKKNIDIDRWHALWNQFVMDLM